MTTVELIERIRKRAANPRRRTSASHLDLERFNYDPRWSREYPPVSLDQVHQADEKLGFELPVLLTQLYTEIGNGGFGPGYGLLGLEGGFTDEQSRLTLPDLYLSLAHPAPGPLPHPPWPKKLVPLCDWGCNMMSCFDCSTKKGKMVFVEDGSRFPEGVTFDQWIEDWAKGIDLLRRARRGQ